MTLTADSPYRLGLFGFGVVGQGLYTVLENSKGFRARIAKIAIKHPDKARTLPAELFTTDPEVLLADPDITHIVELIDDAQAAYDIALRTLRQGKTLISANKKMLAAHLPELVALQQEFGGGLLYEASSCGSIPIIRTLEEYYDNETLHALSGIFNGSSNYILTRIFEEGLDYGSALAQAQALGFAETDPWLDVSGADALNKLVILSYHAFGKYLAPSEVFHYGIASLSAFDIRYAREKGQKIRLVNRAWKSAEGAVTLFTMPHLVGPESLLYGVNYENNAVLVQAAFSQQQLFLGKGAGGAPTGSAVLSDVSAAATYGYRYSYHKAQQNQGLAYNTDVLLRVYLRFTSEQDLALFPFQEVEERYQGQGQGYVIGTLKLAHLLSLQARIINEPGLFLALVDVVE